LLPAPELSGLCIRKEKREKRKKKKEKKENKKSFAGITG
jgi:hypothetical protein